MIKLKTIALVDWNWAGHHPTYFNLFILALEELGFDVLAICPNPSEAAETAAKTRPTANLDGSLRGQTEFRKMDVPRHRLGRLRSARLTAMDWTVRHFTGVEKQIREWMRHTGRRVDMVFYACIYTVDFEWIRLTKPFLHFPWAGLFLHASIYRKPDRRDLSGRLFRPEQIFEGELCKGVAILDEGVASEISSSIGKPVVIFPDVTDERLTANGGSQPLGDRLKQFASGKPIVGLFGHLQRYKGLLTFLQAAKLAAPWDICFALAGNLDLPPSEETSRIHQCLNECPNLWDHLIRIPDGSYLNSLLQSCDIIYAAYLDFPNSSNILTKAAFLKKPVIVSDGFLMAERVRRFNMGEIIPEGNTEALLTAILKIARDPQAWIAGNKPKWVEYCNEHSFKRLKVSFKQLLAFLPE